MDSNTILEKAAIKNNTVNGPTTQDKLLLFISIPTTLFFFSIYYYHVNHAPIKKQ